MPEPHDAPAASAPTRPIPIPTPATMADPATPRGAAANASPATVNRPANHGRRPARPARHAGHARYPT